MLTSLNDRKCRAKMGIVFRPVYDKNLDTIECFAIYLENVMRK